MKHLLVVILLISGISLFARGELRVEYIKELPDTLSNLDKVDAEGKILPVLLVMTDLNGLRIQNVGGPTRYLPIYSKEDQQYMFYMNDKQKAIKISHPDYKTLKVKMDDFYIDVKSQRVYELVLINIGDEAIENITESLKHGTTAKFVVYDKPPVAIKQVPPNYPAIARNSGIEGEVWLEVEVFDDGTVGAIEIVQSLMSGPGGLDESAIEAVRQWIFKPAQRGKKPVSVWVTFPIQFVID